MAGPTGSVVLRDPIDDNDVYRLMAQAFRRSSSWESDWYVADPAVFGMPDEVADAGPVGVGVRRRSAHPRLIEAIGFSPPAEIAVWMGSNQDIDHRLLGHLCLVFALEYGGLVHFPGSLVPFPWPHDIPFSNRTREQRAELASRVARGMRKLPGRLQVVNYGSRTNPSECHVGDAEFLDGWLRHPRFRMIK